MANSTIATQTFSPDDVFNIKLEDVKTKKEIVFQLSYNQLLGKFQKFEFSHEKGFRIIIQNLFRKNRYLELENELLREEISEEEFEKILLNEPEKYIINLRDEVSENERLFFISLAKNLSEEFDELSRDEIAHLFSINPNNFIAG